MPVVRRYGSRQVGTAALPSARRTAAETAISQGAGLEEARAGVGMAIARVGNTVAERAAGIFAREQTENRRLREQERDRADEVAVMAAESRLGEWERSRLYDPKAGALTLKGKDSFELPETIDEEFGKVAGDVERTLGTPEQKHAFTRIRYQRQTAVALTIRRHVAGEMQAYEANELKAFTENETQLAIAAAQDPRLAAMHLGNAVGKLQQTLPRLGLGEEQVEQQVAAVRSQVHVGIIDQLIATDQQRTAQVYFEEAKGQINGEAIARVERALEAGRVKKEVQTEADTIIAAGGTLTEQRTKAKTIEDPDVRAGVLQQIEHEANVQEKVARDTRIEMLTGVFNTLDKNPNVRAIPAGTWAEMSGGEKSQAYAYAEARVKGVPVETDLGTYYRLMTLARDNPGAFAQENLLSFRGRLGETEFKQLAGMQVSAGKGEENKDLQTFSTFSQMFESTLKANEIDPNKPEALQLRRRFESLAATEQALRGGKDLSGPEMQGLLDRLVLQVSTEKGSWAGFFTSAPFYDVAKRGFDLTIDDVPQAARPQIIDALRKRSIPVTNDTILDTYLRYMATQK